MWLSELLMDPTWLVFFGSKSGSGPKGEKLGTRTPGHQLEKGNTCLFFSCFLILFPRKGGAFLYEPKITGLGTSSAYNGKMVGFGRGSGSRG